jgi:hypothetical protein
MATITKKPAKQPGSDIVVSTTVSLIGLGLLGLLAGVNKQVGKVVLVVVVGFALAWFLIGSNEKFAQKLVSNA